MLHFQTKSGSCVINVVKCIAEKPLYCFTWKITVRGRAGSSVISVAWSTGPKVVSKHMSTGSILIRGVTSVTCAANLSSKTVFSAPEPKAQVHYCDHALSVVRPSSLTFHIFDFSSEIAKRNTTKLIRLQDLNVLFKVCVFRADRKNNMAALVSDWLRHFRLLLWNHWTELNETWQEARPQHPLLSLCFSGRSEKQDGRPGLWLAETFSTSPLKLRNRIQRNLTGSMISTSFTKFVFFWGWSEKQDGRPGVWLAETFSTSPVKQLNGIQRNLTGSKILTSSTKCVFFGPWGKARWPPWPLICWDIFRLLLWNHWTEFNETWQETKSERPLQTNKVYVF